MFDILSPVNFFLPLFQAFWFLSGSRIFNLFFGFEYLCLAKWLDSDFACPVE